MLDLAKHIANQKSGAFDPEKFEDHYETALVDLINQKRAGKPITPKERPHGENVVDLMEALRRRGGREGAEEVRQEAAQGRQRPEGNADADRRQKSRRRRPRRRSRRPGRSGSRPRISKDYR
jgi:DNA end-binding protein Ku